ncbi:MAG: sulfotransferase [Sideroxydans sp.]|nr:sulfotransferase [Sideroxydans sp.]
MVDFIFLGPSKSGSTWIFEAIRPHPQLFVPAGKDIYFFDRYHQRGSDWYESFFRAAPPDSLCGELSHDYFASPDAIRRLHAYNPRAKLICCLRNPFERAYSSYLHLLRVGMFDGTFEQALQQLPFLVEEGKYCSNLHHILSLFARDAVLVLDFDELEADPQRFARRIFDFLGVDADYVPEVLHQRINPAREPRSRLLARLAKQVALRLRQAGYANFLGRLKHSHLVDWLVYRPQAGTMEKPAADYPQALVQLYHSELDGLSALLQTDYSKWRLPSP